MEMLAGLTLAEVFAHAEDHVQTGFQGQAGLLDQLLVRFPVVLTALGVTEDGPGAAGGFQHVHGDLAGVGAGRMVRAVLGGQLDLGSLQDGGQQGQVGKRSSDDQVDFFRGLGGLLGDSLGQGDTFRNRGVHLPVSGNYFLSHAIMDCIFILMRKFTKFADYNR